MSYTVIGNIILVFTLRNNLNSRLVLQKDSVLLQVGIWLWRDILYNTLGGSWKLVFFCRKVVRQNTEYAVKVL